VSSDGSCVDWVRQARCPQALASKARQVEGIGGDAGSNGSASVRGSKVNRFLTNDWLNVLQVDPCAHVVSRTIIVLMVSVGLQSASTSVQCCPWANAGNGVPQTTVSSGAQRDIRAVAGAARVEQAGARRR